MLLLYDYLTSVEMYAKWVRPKSINIANRERTGWATKNTHSDQTTITENKANITATNLSR